MKHHANYSIRTMETGNHFKNDESPKSRMSRNKCAWILFTFIIALTGVFFSSCGDDDKPQPPPATTTVTPAIPTGITAAKENNTIRVSWYQSENATRYAVYRSKEANTSYDSIGISSTTSFIDYSPFENYNYYKVKALSSNSSSGFSEYASYNFVIVRPTGWYLGIIGFNESLKRKDISLLNKETKAAFKSFVDGLTARPFTILYYAADNAIDDLEKVSLPNDLANVSTVTFTDGLDQGSLALDTNYRSNSAYLGAVNGRIKNTKIKGLNISAYSIGLRGNDISDDRQFRDNLSKLASRPENVKEIVKMGELDSIFLEIARSLYKETSTQTLRISIPNKEAGAKIRFTFDVQGENKDVSHTDAVQSKVYIEGTISSTYSLQNIVYHGLKSSSGTTVPVERSGLSFIFYFNNVIDNSSEEFVSTEHLKEWNMITTTSSKWQVNTEFMPADDAKSTVDKKSAVTMLVLDCSSSLGVQIEDMKKYANNFIDFLSSVSSENPSHPSVSTPEVTNITSTSATLHGYITSAGDPPYTTKGICYSTSANPTINNSKVVVSGSSTGAFSANITGLTANKTYYVRAYATGILGTNYGRQVSFTTKGQTPPAVTTLSVTNITSISATLHGNITSAGDPPYTEKGICYSTSANPTINSTKAVVSGSGTGAFSANVTGLTVSRTYYARAYAITASGPVYGNQVSFTTAGDNSYILGNMNIAVQSSDLSGNVTWSQAYSLCSNSRVAGYSNWRLPTLDELQVIYGYRNAIGGFVSQYYWTSTVGGSSHYYVNFNGGGYNYSGSSDINATRCVRTR